MENSKSNLNKGSKIGSVKIVKILIIHLESFVIDAN